jgi:hypothetical protein
MFTKGFVVLYILCSGIVVAGRGQEAASDIIEKLKAFDDIVLQQHTLTIERSQDKQFFFDFDPVGFKETVTVTVDGDTTAYSVTRYYDKEPSFPQKKQPPSYYTREGNIIIWRDTNRQGLIGPDLNANRAQRITTTLTPDNKVILQDEGAPSVEFKPVDSDDTHVLDHLVPILSTGRGYGHHLVRAKEIIEETANEITFTAYGRFGRDEALWKLTVDTQNGYLVRSAEFYGEGRPPILAVSTKGTKWFGDRCIAETSSYWVSQPNNVVAGKVKKYEPRADRELIAETRKLFTELSPNTDVVDWRGNTEDPLMYRVGHLPLSDRDMLKDVFDSNIDVLPDKTNKLHEQGTNPQTNISERPKETDAIASEGNIDGTKPLSRTNAGKIALLILAIASIAIMVMIWRYKHAKKTDKS